MYNHALTVQGPIIENMYILETSALLRKFRMKSVDLSLGVGGNQAWLDSMFSRRLSLRNAHTHF